MSSAKIPEMLFPFRLKTERELALQTELASRMPVRLNPSRTILLTNSCVASSQVTPTHLPSQGSELVFQPQFGALTTLPGESFSMNKTSASVTCCNSESAIGKRRRIKIGSAQKEVRSILDGQAECLQNDTTVCIPLNEAKSDHCSLVRQLERNIYDVAANCQLAEFTKMTCSL